MLCDCSCIYKPGLDSQEEVQAQELIPSVSFRQPIRRRFRTTPRWASGKRVATQEARGRRRQLGDSGSMGTLCLGKASVGELLRSVRQQSAAGGMTIALGWRASPSASPKFWALGQATLPSGPVLSCLQSRAEKLNPTFNQPLLQPASWPKVNTLFLNPPCPLAPTARTYHSSQPLRRK